MHSLAPLGSFPETLIGEDCLLFRVGSLSAPSRRLLWVLFPPCHRREAPERCSIVAALCLFRFSVSFRQLPLLTSVLLMIFSAPSFIGLPYMSQIMHIGSQLTQYIPHLGHSQRGRGLFFFDLLISISTTS